MVFSSEERTICSDFFCFRKYIFRIGSKNFSKGSSEGLQKTIFVFYTLPVPVIFRDAMFLAF